MCSIADLLRHVVLSLMVDFFVDFRISVSMEKFRCDRIIISTILQYVIDLKS